MGSHDCIVLYNAAFVSDRADCEEKINPAYIIREDVGAVEESLRELGFHPYVFSVDRFSKDLVQVLLDVSPKFVFNLCEEIDGNSELEMYAAGLLELMEIPYTGSKPFALGLALNKFHVKQILRSAGIPAPRGYLRFPERKSRAPRGMRLPVIVKPGREDASLGINSHSVCRTADQIEKQIQYVHSVYEQEALVEEYLEGREFNVSIMGQDNPEVLAISEIDFSGLPEGEPKIVSYRAKWDEGSPLFSATIPICPANLAKRLENRIHYIAIRSYQCIGCRDYARIDMRTDSRGNLYVLEVNPNPDISPEAGFARAVRAAGYSYSEMIQRISEAAMARGANVAPTVYAF
jgi:D-alanine-D-alanine ligase